MKNVRGKCDELSTITNAYTIKPIVYKSYTGIVITIPINEPIIVDINEGIALIGKDHVSVSEDQYRPAPFVTAPAPARTTVEITYKKYEGKEIVVPAGTYVCIDEANEIALIGKDHLIIQEEEWVPATVTALTTKNFAYRTQDGVEVEVPVNEYISVDEVAGIALINGERLELANDFYRRADN